VRAGCASRCGLFSLRDVEASELPRVLGVYAGRVRSYVEAEDAAAERLGSQDATSDAAFALEFCDAWQRDACTGEELALEVDAARSRNLVAYGNDARGVATRVGPFAPGGSPALHPQDAACVNFAFLHVAVDGLPFVVAVQTAPVLAGGELLGDYGRSYWTAVRAASVCELPARAADAAASCHVRCGARTPLSAD
jgi:hypothetical protein